MRTRLSDEFVESVAEGDAAASRALLAAIWSRLKGYNMFTLSPRALLRLSALDLPPDHLRILELMERDFILGGAAELEFEVWLVAGAEICTCETTPFGKRLVVSPDTFLAVNADEMPIIVLENVLEIDFLFQVLAWFQNQTYGFTLSTCAKAVHGAGDTVAAVTEREARDRHVLVFVDTDQDCDGGKRGQTLKAVRRVQRRNRTRVHLYEYPVREVENLVPVGAIKSGLRTSAYVVEVVSRVEDIAGVVPAIRPFHDWKKGLSRSKLQLMASSGPGVPYASAIWEAIESGEMDCSICKQPLRRDEPPNPTCECVVIRGLGDKLLEHSVRSIEKGAARCEPDAWLTTRWKRIGSMLNAWTLAAPRVTV